MIFDFDKDVQITRWAAAHSGFAFASQTNARASFNTSGDVDRKRFFFLAAALTVVMTKSPDTALTAAEKERIGQRQGLKMQPGMILTDVLPGEEPKVVSSDRPNPNLGDHRFDMLRAVSAGTGAGASTIGRRYEGNYSAQRQELVEGDVGYARLHGAFVASGEIQKWARLLDLAVLSKALILDGDVDLATLHHADYPRPPPPWTPPSPSPWTRLRPCSAAP